MSQTIRISTRAIAIAVIVLTGILLLTYSVVKSYENAFTHDEAMSYLHSTTKSFGENVMLTRQDAGNHPLNTWGMYACSKIFGNSEFSLRLPNVMAHVLYLIASFMLLRRLKNSWLLVVGFWLLNFQPLLLDFFTVARGYGIGLAFILTGIWLYVDACHQTDRNRFQVLSLLSVSAATLAVWANFIFIYFLLFICLMVLWQFKSQFTEIKLRQFFKLFKESEFSAMVIYMAWTALFVFFFVVLRLLNLSRISMLGAGGDIGSSQDAMQVLINYSMPAFFANAPWAGWHVSIPGVMPMAQVTVLLLGLWGVWALIVTMRSKEQGIAVYRLPAWLLAALIAIVNLVHYGLKQNLPNARTGMLFIIFFAILIVYAMFITDQKGRPWMKKVNRIIQILLLAFLLINTALSINTRQNSWPRDADTKIMMADLQKIAGKESDSIKVTLGTEMLLEPSINYYRIVNNARWLQKIQRRTLQTPMDYYFIQSTELDTLRAMHHVEIVKQYERTGNYLIRRLEP